MKKQEVIIKILTPWEKTHPDWTDITAIESNAQVYREALRALGSKKKLKTRIYEKI